MVVAGTAAAAWHELGCAAGRGHVGRGRPAAATPQNRRKPCLRLLAHNPVMIVYAATRRAVQPLGHGPPATHRRPHPRGVHRPGASCRPAHCPLALHLNGCIGPPQMFRAGVVLAGIEACSALSHEVRRMG